MRGGPWTEQACDYSHVNGPATLCRAACVRCLRPQATCLCALARPTAHRTEVLVLQHPQEQRQAKNSVALLRLSLAQCEVAVGEHFAPGALQTLLQRPGRDTRLLYPDVPAAPAPGTDASAPLRLVVLDATWRNSLRMLLEHPALAALPRRSPDAPVPTHCRAIRAARRAGQVSTLEATVLAIAKLEGPSFDAESLLDAFGRFVAGVAARQRPRASSGQAWPAPGSPILRPLHIASGRCPYGGSSSVIGHRARGFFDVRVFVMLVKDRRNPRQSVDPPRTERPVFEALTSTSRPIGDIRRKEVAAAKTNAGAVRRGPRRRGRQELLSLRRNNEAGTCGASSA